MKGRPPSIAIAGAWGYIGRKILDAALRRGWSVSVFDPGPWPADLDPGVATRLADVSTFYALPADWFHLALHPEAREEAQRSLLQRARAEPVWILNEKPMFAPDLPADGPGLIEAVDHSGAVMLYDFPELYDPLTGRIMDILAGFDRVDVSSITVERSKDREDPAIPRNYKRMVPIQFQESVHCLAFVLVLLGSVRGGLSAALADGVTVSAASQPYAPPNPQAYDRVVDGRCDYQLRLGSVTVDGLTNFKRRAPWTKRRTIRGQGDGRPFFIEADYLEGGKFLRVDGVDQHWNATACSYESILTTASTWRRTVPRDRLLSELYPNPRLAWMAFQLSGALWRSCHERARLHVGGLPEWNTFDHGYRSALSDLPRYSSTPEPST